MVFLQIPWIRKNSAPRRGRPSDSRACTTPSEAETEPLTAGSLTDERGRKPSICSALSGGAWLFLCPQGHRASKSTCAKGVQRAQLSGPLGGDGHTSAHWRGASGIGPGNKIHCCSPRPGSSYVGSAVLSTALIQLRRGRGDRGIGEARPGPQRAQRGPLENRSLTDTG